MEKGIGNIVAGSQTNPEGVITPEEEESAIELEALTRTNLATCYLHLGDARKALDAVNLALLDKPGYWKAHFRKAQALLQIKSHELALVALQEAEHLETVSQDNGAVPAIRELRTKVKLAMREEEKAQTNALRGFLKQNE